MKKVLTITALLMAVMLVCSCGGSGGSAEDNAPVRVSFAVETPHESLAKIASVDTPNTTFTYWYKAVPQWTGADFTAIQGSTNNAFVQITDYEDDKDIGLFAQGSWKFYAQVKANGVVLYESDADPEVTYINASNTSVTLDVTRTAGQGTANVTIAIEAPDTGDSPNLTASYSGQASGNVTISKVAATEHTGGGWSRYTGTATGLASGSYLFTLTTTDGTNTVGGAVLAFDIIPGVNRAITGTIENGVFQTALITINVPTFTMEVTAANSATSVAKNTALVYTCTASATNITGNIAYQWYVNNTPVASNGTSSTYSFSQATPGYYYVTCKAYIDGKVAGSQSLKVTVTNN